MKQMSTAYEIMGARYDRVTSVLSPLSPTNILINWSRRQTIEAAATVSQVDHPDRRVWKDEVYQAAKSRMEVKRNLGSNVHAAIDQHFNGESVVDRWLPWVTQAEKAMEALLDTPASYEVTLVNEDLKYAGTVDVWSDEVILDWKTGRLYPQHLIQLWCYMNATHWWSESRQELVEIETSPDTGHAVHLEEDSWSKETITRGSELFDYAGETFQALQKVRHWDAITKEMM